MAEKPYPKPEYVVKRDLALLQCSRERDKVVEMPREQPCNIILVHGVNDVGTGYSEVETGLCAGLADRLLRRFRPATYRLPGAEDKKKTWEDPDDVFFKRKTGSDTDSPVIPFYWGYREVDTAARAIHGQKTDRFGNRLDKDLSKGGGPFGNATSTLPDMWNRGVYAPLDPAGDPLRPIRTGPGRMYMVLAARRLAALIAMIRKYEPKDTVNIVAHSQGCLLSLLAQAFLMEMGQRTADTLILTHPPYSLEEEMGPLMKGMTYFGGGEDAAMRDHYDLIDGRQTVEARLQTLVNIVAGVAKSKGTEPVFEKISESDCGGMVEGRWKPGDDRDNRGKVYLYFCPEDMTVALDNIQGIGWQGVPDYISKPGLPKRVASGYLAAKGGTQAEMRDASRSPMKELGPGFRQRVFTAKLRGASGTGEGKPVLVGQPPHDFILRLRNEDDHAHVAGSGRALRASLPAISALGGDTPEARRYGVRTINGEALRKPFVADIRGNQIDPNRIPAHSRVARTDKNEPGPCEEVDPIDAAIALTGRGGMVSRFEELPPSISQLVQTNIEGPVPRFELTRLEAAYSQAKHPESTSSDDKYHIIFANRNKDGKIVAQIRESPNAARLRWQQELSPKSFHSVIFASRKNHQFVTAYDLSIGSGKAVSDPRFYAYLCAVADWRCTMPKLNNESRPSIRTWKSFLKEFSAYYACEPNWCQKLITGNVSYYSYGVLPSSLPLPRGELWSIVVAATTAGKRVSGQSPSLDRS